MNRNASLWRAARLDQEGLMCECESETKLPKTRDA